MKQLNKFTRRLMFLMLTFFSLGYVNAQIQVSGKLTDANGEALIGASIAEVGTTNGTFTEFDGSWSISVKGPESKLEFSYVGFVTQVKTVGNNKTMNVVLKTDAVQMEAVMKIGFASAKPEDVTSAITQVKDVGGKPVLGVDQALQGRAAGVQVRSNSGSPGAAMSINIRGIGSINGDTRPLYVVDGIPVGNEWKGDPQTVENISILKDASSCAIYGSRGANGVILITTKGGNGVGDAGQGEYSTISFDGYKGVQSTWKQIDVASAEEFAQIRNAEKLAAGDDSAYTQSQIDKFSNTNWQDEVFRKAIIEKYKITLDGGSAKSSWSASGGYLNQEGIVKGTGYTKYDIGYKYMYKLTEKLDFGMGSGFSLTERQRIQEGDLEQSVLGCALIADPTVSVYDSTGNWSNPVNNTFANPVGMIETREDVTKGYGVGTNVWADYKLIKGLNLHTSYSYNKWENDRQIFTPKFYINAQNQSSAFGLSREIQGGSGWVTSNTLTYNYNIKDKVDTNKVKHGFRFLVGQEALYEFSETYNVVAEGGLLSYDPNMKYVAAGSTLTANVKNWQLPTEHSMLSLLGRVEYSFMDKYLINASIRKDGSSRFGSGKKWGYFPAFGVAWKVNKEPFFYNNEWLKTNVNLFKIRGGYGKIGNENFGNYKYVSSINGNDLRSGYNFNGTRVPGATAISVPNELVQWEEATSTNVGTDISFWKNKLTVNLDYFVKNNVNNLIYISVPAVVGIDGSSNNPISNEGKIQNKGVEATFVYKNSWKPDSAVNELKYDVNFNITKNTNTVIYVDNQIPGGYLDRTGSNVCYTKEGYPIASFWGYQIDGLYTSWADVNAGAQPDAQPGDYKIVDVNGDGQITVDDITNIGSPHPDFTYGLNLNASYAGIDFGLSFQGSQGNEVYNFTKWYLDGGYLNSNYSTRRLDIYSADNTGSDQPTDATWFTGKSSSSISSAFIEDGSYLRLKNVTLGYTLPTKLTEKIKLNNLRLYAQAQNILTFTKYSGFDPEIGTNADLNYEGPEYGIDRGVYPQARSIVFGVNLQF